MALENGFDAKRFMELRKFILENTNSLDDISYLLSALTSKVGVLHQIEQEENRGHDITAHRLRHLSIALLSTYDILHKPE